MRKQLLQWGCIGFAGLLALPGVTFAQQQAYTNSPVNMRAGPAGDYPIVTQLPGGVPVTVMGCISGYSWCDVVVPNLRGWVYAGRLSYPYQGGNVPILTYGPTIGLPIVTFSIGAYWGSYYRGRPWYNQQSHWANRPPPGPGRPPGHGGRPPPGPQPVHGGGGRPPGPPPGHGAGGRPGGPPPGQGAGGRPPGQSGGGGRPPGPPPNRGGGGGNGGGGGHGGGGQGGHGGGGNQGGHGGGNNQQPHG
ncbi:SH3 domain-containing protein [Caballeronia udeis]|uniref:SH3 domain-containing protein n=1 Tax=Caballeronia udeis TaxID=1232866 RepID=UPI0009502788|nr:SH3 domain-containing protein [Caballeronia udeis]